MTKQQLHAQIAAGADIREITDKELESLCHCWLDDKLCLLPKFTVFCSALDERRRREVERASKPMRDFDRNFF
jgi:hypothetical protein